MVTVCLLYVVVAGLLFISTDRHPQISLRSQLQRCHPAALPPFLRSTPTRHSRINHSKRHFRNSATACSKWLISASCLAICSLWNSTILANCDLQISCNHTCNIPADLQHTCTLRNTRTIHATHMRRACNMRGSTYMLQHDFVVDESCCFLRCRRTAMPRHCGRRTTMPPHCSRLAVGAGCQPARTCVLEC